LKYSTTIPMNTDHSKMVVTAMMRQSYFDSALSSNLSNPIVLTKPLILPNSISGGLVILNNSITQSANAFYVASI